MLAVEDANREDIVALLLRVAGGNMLERVDNMKFTYVLLFSNGRVKICLRRSAIKVDLLVAILQGSRGLLGKLLLSHPLLPLV